MPAVQPFGVTDLLLLLLDLQPQSAVSRGELRDGSPPRGRCEVGPEGRERLPRLSERRLQSLLPAYGLQGKCSKQTGFLVRSSSRAQQSDSPDAHFLSSAEKCCVSLLSAHFCVFGFCSRSARWGVSQAQFTVTRNWLQAESVVIRNSQAVPGRCSRVAVDMG